MKSSDKDFVAEAEELLESAGNILVELQESPSDEPNPDSINALFRAMHTLKGMAGIYGYHGISEISHSLESLLDDVRMGRAAMGSRVLGFLFRQIDILRSSLEDVLDAATPEDPEAIAARKGEIEAFRESLKGGGDAAASLEGIPEELLRVLSEYEEHRLRHNIQKGNAIYLIGLVFSIMDFDVELKKVTERLKPLGELISTMPISDNVPPGSIGFSLMLGSAKSEEEIAAAAGVDPKRLVKGRAAAQPVMAEASQGQLRSTTTTVRVNIEKLDKILNTINEISIIRSANQNIWTGLVERYGHTPLLIDMYRINQSFDRRLSELQDNVLGLRMVPIAQMFGRLAQIVRRYSNDIDKKIDLHTFGDDTEMDKFLAEEIIDPLMHIVRNSIDHGIEDSDERLAAGKPESGTITLSAYQRGNSVVVEVRDDGRGIDIERIREKALERGLITPDMEPTRHELIAMIFMPSFSTKDSVSEVSGRGVGLDVVKSKLSSLGAKVDIETETGRGTSFILTLPITVAIIRSLMVKAGEELFAVPVSALQETTAVDPTYLSSLEGKAVYNLRGEMLPIVALNDIFNIPTIAVERQFAFIVGADERKLGVLVDEIIGQQDVVIKPISEYLGSVKGFAGAAEISRHRVVLVLDVESLIAEAFLRRRRGSV